MSDLIAARPVKISLPSLLHCENGSPVRSATQWYNIRRQEIIRLCEQYLFGRIPPRPQSVSYELLGRRTDALDGRAERREIRIHLENRGVVHHIDVLWYLPGTVSAPVPLIIGLNFKGNAACSREEDLPGENPGMQAARWQLEMLIKAGFSVMTAARNDFYPDHDEGRPKSIFRLWQDAPGLAPCGQTAISAWAFGTSRLLDLALSESMIDPCRIWLHGHSRLGKAALWAAACDPRFTGCISNDSGTGGAALMREKLPDAESLSSITEMLHWWFIPELRNYAGHEEKLPFDMHFLAALLLPRPLLIASASEDRWADPYNEFRTAVALTPVCRLFGSNGLEDFDFPSPGNCCFGEGVGYYLREGKHDVTEFDWEMTLKFIVSQEHSR